MNIYELELHQSISIDTHTHVMRVPGGWIYERHHEKTSLCTFVPYHEDGRLMNKRTEYYDEYEIKPIDKDLAAWYNARGFKKCPDCKRWMDKVCSCKIFNR